MYIFLNSKYNSVSSRTQQRLLIEMMNQVKSVAIISDNYEDRSDGNVQEFLESLLEKLISSIHKKSIARKTKLDSLTISCNFLFKKSENFKRLLLEMTSLLKNLKVNSFAWNLGLF